MTELTPIAWKVDRLDADPVFVGQSAYEDEAVAIACDGQEIRLFPKEARALMKAMKLAIAVVEAE